MANTVSEAVARPVRGLGQGGAAWAIVEAIEAFDIYNFTERQSNITIILLGAVISMIQNTVENRLGKGILRAVPPKVVPVVDNADGDGLEPVPQPVQTDNSPRPEDPVDQPPQDPNYIPPTEVTEFDDTEPDQVPVDVTSERAGDLS